MTNAHPTDSKATPALLPAQPRAVTCLCQKGRLRCSSPGIGVEFGNTPLLPGLRGQAEESRA